MFRFCAFADEASPLLTGQIEALHRNNIDLLEIRGVNHVNISKLTEADARETRKLLDSEGISVWSMGSPMGKYPLAEPFAPHLDEFKRLLELTEILGARHIRLFSFFPAEGADPEETKKEALERLAAFCEVTPSHIMLCHENEKNIFGEDAESCLAIHRALPRLRAVFDPANFVQCGVNTLEAWTMLHNYVDYMHIKDARGSRVVPPGQGEGNLPTLLQNYRQNGGTVLTLEPHLTKFVGLDALEQGSTDHVGLPCYRDSDEAFDAAVTALRGIIADLSL